MNQNKVLVTGGAGFIGSHYVRRLVARGAQVLNVDLLTYAGDERRLEDCRRAADFRTIKADVVDADAMIRAMEKMRPQLVVHFAAETHVTRSEFSEEVFKRTNIEGTRTVLDAAKSAGVPRVVHVSTDEVYGSIEKGSFREEDKLGGEGGATSPYARSKAVADDLALSYSDDFGVVVVRPTNAFGPWQHPEKAIARWITRGLRNEPLLVWGDGQYVRQWLYVEDLVDAVSVLAESGESGRAYNVGPALEPEVTNQEVAMRLAELMDLRSSMVRNTTYDRPGHDRRYSVDPSDVMALGWTAGDLWDQLALTVDWYKQNQAWWDSHLERAEAIYSDSDT